MAAAAGATALCTVCPAFHIAAATCCFPALLTSPLNCCSPTCHPHQVRREKGIYHTLNKLSMDVTRKVGAAPGLLYSGCWQTAAGRSLHKLSMSATHKAGAAHCMFSCAAAMLELVACWLVGRPRPCTCGCCALHSGACPPTAPSSPPTPGLLQVLVAEAWVPVAAKARVQDALRVAAARASSTGEGWG